MKQLKEKIINILKQIPDPELGISIWDLGLIYDIKIVKGKVEILMTLTTMGCPLFSQIADPVKTEIEKMPEVESVYIDLTFEPPWTPEKMSKDARIQLGL
ncbi:metal-sulfur cluster assembly factor [Candidatus Gottesmanbacteria bacterium]|nr:metal-sulfur cluster assembly factor [Candidatus Gottesmanbacteria bacterium]